MYEVAKIGGWLLSPLSVVLAGGLLAWALLAFGKRRAALSVGAAAFLLLWVASLPVTAALLTYHLESRYPALTVEQTPSADAIVVLGGALAGAHPPVRPTFTFGPAAGRVWHAAALYRARKGPVIIVAAGTRSNEIELQPEAQAIAEMLEGLGVPRQAILLARDSRNTRENAAQALAQAQVLHARNVLLVTSAIHMPRALSTFDRLWRGQGIQVVPAATDHRALGTQVLPHMWLPSASALADVNGALKEFAGMIALTIM